MVDVPVFKVTGIEFFGLFTPGGVVSNLVLVPLASLADQTPEGMDMLNAGVADNVIAFLQGRSRNRVV